MKPPKPTPKLGKVTRTGAAVTEERAFAEVIDLIQTARQRTFAAVNTALINLYWQVGAYLSRKLETAEWGEGVVEELARYIAHQHPDIKGFTRANLFRMRQFHDTYRHNTFGPDKLKSLDGERLLQAMHTHGNKESLVYWLEFKNDDEFPGPKLGSISGGSAHKFRLFRRNTGQWVKGGSRSEENISEAEAVVIAREHRDQLLAGVALLEKLPANADDDQYRQLQEQLTRIAPDISGLGWGHKYLSLLFPDKLDDYHSHRWQRFHLIKLLQLPPEQEGLYVCAGYFVRLADQLGWPMNHLTTALNERNGYRPLRYWRIGTSLGEKESIWQDMEAGGYVAIGWGALGDLSNLGSGGDLKEAIRPLLEHHYPGDSKVITRKAGEIRNFVEEIAEGEIVLAANGELILGLGRVTGEYRFEATVPTGAPHRRTVEWVATEQWQLPTSEGLRTTVWELKKERNLLEIERRLLDRYAAAPPEPLVKRPIAVASHMQRLLGIPGRVQEILARKGQAILYGPPGTGKTYWARKAAFDLAALKVFGRFFDELSDQEKVEVEGTPTKPGLVRCCTFHPAYGYETFSKGSAHSRAIRGI